MTSLSDGQGEDDNTEHQQIEPPRTPRPRPQSIGGVTDRVRTGHGNMYITVNFEGSNPFEVFSVQGKAGLCDNAYLEAISRLVSLALRSGIDAQEVISQLRGITCCPAWDDGKLIRSSPDAIAVVLERHLKPTFPRESPSGMPENQRCPDCNNPFIIQERMAMCTSCGWNRELT